MKTFFTTTMRVLLIMSLAALCSFAMVGCATDSPVLPPPTVVTKLQLVHPSAALLADCTVAATPPDPDTFAAKQLPTETERLRFQLGLLSDYSAALQTDLKNCKAKPQVLRDWFANEDKLYPSTP